MKPGIRTRRFDEMHFVFVIQLLSKKKLLSNAVGNNYLPQIPHAKIPIIMNRQINGTGSEKISCIV